MAADPHHDIDDDGPGAGDRAAVHRVVTTTVLPWLRFVGPGRILGAVGAALVLVGIAWWMLRSPAVPTESRLPLAQRVEAVVADVNTTSSGAPTTLMPTTSVASVVIHVTGAVRTPGVYDLHLEPPPPLRGPVVRSVHLGASGAELAIELERPPAEVGR